MWVGEQTFVHKLNTSTKLRLNLQFTGGDIAHAQKVVGYSHRHLAQRPANDIGETPWRYSLMNWGHDPQKSKA